MGPTKLTPTIAVDFDGTLCSDAFPDIGKPNQPLIDFLIRWQQEGNKVILWTCREDTLLWIAVDWCAEHGVTIDEVIRRGWDVGVIWQDGRPFHGPCHIRMNLALPLSRVQEAFDRLDQYVFNA